LSRGDVVLVSFPFTDLPVTKLRPAVVLHADADQEDFVLAFVGSRDIGRRGPGDVTILPSHPEFGMSGLAAPSKIRTAKLVTLSRSLLRRWLGRLGPQLAADLDRALIMTLEINLVPAREEGRLAERARLARLHASGGPAAVLADLGGAS
jgi:mRNA interferase MazF